MPRLGQRDAYQRHPVDELVKASGGLQLERLEPPRCTCPAMWRPFYSGADALCADLRDEVAIQFSAFSRFGIEFA